ncbi:MAG TPA: hypothetical protein GXX28_02185 [Firmicutes bacterium]|nr:hypothetical protein [Bacillota bacterium]
MFWAAVVVAVAMSVDGLWEGLAFGLRRVRIGPRALLAISLISGGCAWLAMTVGGVVGRAVPGPAARWASAGLLLAIGVTMLYDAYVERSLAVASPPAPSGDEAPGEIGSGEAVLLGLVVAFDAGIAAFTLGLAGFASTAVPVLMGAAHWALVGLGNLLGVRRLIHSLTSRFVYLPGGLLVVLGLLRIR